MIKNNDFPRLKVMSKTIDFLLEECNQIENCNLKVEIFMNVISFLREWYRHTSSMILPVKTFECLTMLCSIFNQIDFNVFVSLIEHLMKPLQVDQYSYQSPGSTRDTPRSNHHHSDIDIKANKFIELINFIEQPQKFKSMIELAITLLENVCRCGYPEEMKTRKPFLLNVLAELLKQSDSFWTMCLKFEDNVARISAIKR